MAPHSNTLTWKIPWTEELGRLQSMGSLRVRHDWATSLSLSLSYIGEGNGNPLQCSCLENPRDEGAWWAAIYGIAQSQTRLKRLSSTAQSRGLGPDQVHFQLNCMILNQRLPWPQKLAMKTMWDKAGSLQVQSMARPLHHSPTLLYWVLCVVVI